MIEEWRPVVGYEGLYEISNFGRVRTCPTILKTQRGSRGEYRRLRLYNDQGGRFHSVHSLVAAAFIGPRPPEQEINHIDGDPTNNAPENLEYCTRLENMQHSFRVLRTMKPPPSGARHNSITHPETFQRGERHGNAKLTVAKVLAIREHYALGNVSQPTLAREYAVSLKVIWQVVNRKTWTHV